MGHHCEMHGAEHDTAFTMVSAGGSQAAAVETVQPQVI